MERKSNLILGLILLNTWVFLSPSNAQGPAAGGAPGAAPVLGAPGGAPGGAPVLGAPGGAPGGAPVLGAGASTIDIGQLGAKPGADAAPALEKAWKQACESTTPVKIVVPAGNYTLSVIAFTGPCKAPICFELAGNFEAPMDEKLFKGVDIWVKFERLADLTVKGVSGGGIFDGNGEKVWSNPACFDNGLCATRPYNLRFFDIKNSMIDGITTVDSKQFHTMVLSCENVTIQNYKVRAPATARNTDGLHVARSKFVKILNADIQTGDDCISVGDGTKNLTIEGVSCGPGHGISIGSLGKNDKEEDVEGISVKNCTIKNTDNGIRIKSWLHSKPLSASGMHFEGVTMDNVSNPVLIDQAYCPSANCDASVPSQVKISDVSFKNIKGTSFTKSVIRLVCSRGFPCQDIRLEDIDIEYKGAQPGEAVSECCNVKPVITGTVKPQACATTTNEADAAKKITADTA